MWEKNLKVFLKCRYLLISSQKEYININIFRRKVKFEIRLLRQSKIDSKLAKKVQ